ncbi:MAG: ATP-binding protein [Agathobaculum sp.]|uniref:ATP-binding protein n=1 Tax=Agathobaculum sp. TaxID=2048138 RepID=UPI002A81E325|nr:ATP-binding protein [Agathobaculum sp.]MDY3710973.1 ATP-binding protein [Agathobaculum sp.]
MELTALSLRARALSVLRGLQKHPLVTRYMDTLDALERDAARFADCYGALCQTLLACEDPSRAMLDAVHFDVNSMTDTIAAPTPAVLYAASHDLEVLSALLALDGAVLKAAAVSRFSAPALRELPDFPAAAPLPFADGAALAAYYRADGYGFFAQATAFAMQDDGQLAPIPHPDPVRLCELPGYAHQKAQILQNTRAFLAGREANNILLYGDKGTGKSSTVKAVVNEYADEGLKIIQMAPRHIAFFPALFAQTLRSPFRFIVYLDDLSFDREDASFAALKAFIEGGLAGKPAHLIIYATSNRRYLIRESMADRQGDEVRVRDTLETVTSLSDRFGLEITFSVPDKDEYLYIVEQLAAESGLDLPREELHLLAERFALRRNGRSPRTARQFISQQLAEQFAASSG